MIKKIKHKQIDTREPLRCPRCDFDYLHLTGSVSITEHDERDKERTGIAEVSVRMECEGCLKDSYFFMTFHEGQLFMEVAPTNS